MEELNIIDYPQYPQKWYSIVLKFTLYFMMYIVIPIYLYNWVIDSTLLHQISRQIIQIIYVSEIRVIVNILIILILYKLYKRTMSIIFGRLQLNLKTEWMEYLSYKGWKIKYYKNLSLWVSILNSFCTFFSNTADYVCKFYTFLMKASGFFLIAFIYFLFSSVICAKYERILFGFNVWESKILINYVNGLNMEVANLIAFFIYSLLLTSFLLLMAGLLCFFIINSILKSVFPVTDMRVDTSDIPLSFIGNAIKDLDVFDFAVSPLQKQNKKDQITQLISFALDFFIKVDNGKKEPDYTNFCYILWSGHLSEATRNDVLFRANGLYKKIDELCIKINNMNNEEEKNAIVHNLRICLKVMKERDLSSIEPVPYKIKKSDLTAFLIKASIFLQKII